MNKKLEKALFNIYDVVVFEDENGIAQDCVCAIGKDKEVDKEVDIIECNHHIISIYEDGSYKVWEKDGKNMPYYATGKKIIHLYTLKNDNRYYDIYPIDDYGIIDNTKSSEAVNCLEAFNRLMEESPEVHTESYNLVYNSLKRLEAINNAKPSEAINCLDYLDSTCGCFATDKEYEAVNIIKQVLLKAQLFDKA